MLSNANCFYVFYIIVLIIVNYISKFLLVKLMAVTYQLNAIVSSSSYCSHNPQKSSPQALSNLYKMPFPDWLP